MNNTAIPLLKQAARQGLISADVARLLIDRVRHSDEPMRLVEQLMVQGGHCTIEQVRQLREELANTAAEIQTDLPQIPGYRILDRLGSGGMGDVYRAQQISMQRMVALKLLNRDLLRDPSLGERFMREARAAGTISHPHVVGCIDVGLLEGRYFMALEYVAGGDAEHLVRTYDHRLGELRALEIVRDCARGLKALHDAGFIHRDIKPSNILLTEDGMAKIGDLGLIAIPVADQKLTQSGVAIGTPAYMSPEQADAARDIDVRTDIYSLGAALFYLLTGHPPYTGQSAWAVVAKVINDPFPDPRRLNPKVSAASAAVVLKATAKDRRNRYQTASEMRQALDDLLIHSTDNSATIPSATKTNQRPTSHVAKKLIMTNDVPTFSKARAPRWVMPLIVGVAIVIISVQAIMLFSGSVAVPAANKVNDSASFTAPISVVESVPVTPPSVTGIVKSPTSSVLPQVTAQSPNSVMKSSDEVVKKVESALVPVKPANWLQQPATANVVAPLSEPPKRGNPSAPIVTPAVPSTAPVTEAPSLPVVAVLGCEAGSIELRDFAKAFPELLTVSLSRKGAFDLVERTQLRQVLNEQELTQSGMIDSSNAARIGQLVGARILITQRVYAAGNYTYVSAKAIDVESGRVKAVSKGELTKNAMPALMAAQLAIDLGKAVDALSAAALPVRDDVSVLVAQLVAAVRGKRLPIIVIAVEESHVQLTVTDPAVRTELGYLLRKAGFRVIENDSAALATWAKEYSAGRTAPFPADLGAVDVVIAGSGVSQTIGTIGALSSARARLEMTAIAVRDGQVLAVERATTSAADASAMLAGKTALEKAVRQIAVGFASDMTKGWSER